MLLDKLWVRIRGSLLTLKEDFSLGDEVRERAQRLLEKLDLQEASGETGPDVKKPSKVDQEEHVQVTRTQTLEEIRQEWEELLRSKESGKDRSSGSSQQPPNPRRLG